MTLLCVAFHRWLFFLCLVKDGVPSSAGSGTLLSSAFCSSLANELLGMNPRVQVLKDMLFRGGICQLVLIFFFYYFVA